MSDTGAGNHKASENGRGTFPLADVAVVRMRGGDIPEPGSGSEELILAAWKVYRYVLARAKREGKEAIQHGIDGFTWNGELPGVYPDIWTAGASPLPSHDLPLDKARSAVTNWLLTSRNVSIMSRGRDAMTTKKEGTRPGATSRWWISNEFLGVPPGMSLPEQASQELQERILAVTPVTAASGGPAAVPDPNPRNWWCTFANFCQMDNPVSRAELGTHLFRVHQLKPGSGMYDIAMAEAEALREGSPVWEEPEEAYTPPAPVPAPVPAPALRIPPAAARSLISLGAPPAPAPAPAVTAAPDPAPAAASISAQGRVFASMVADLEQANADLRRENQALQDRLRRIEPEGGDIRLSDGEIERIARRLASLISLRDGS